MVLSFLVTNPSVPIRSLSPLVGLIDSVLWYWGLIANLEGRPQITKDSREVRPCIPEFPFIVLHLSVSPTLKVQCNKIATAGIINELEWARREELISYL